MSGVTEPIAQLIGREAELGLAESLLASTRLVSLVGPGGAGKTRLAVEIAARRQRSGGDVAFVDFSGLREAAHMTGQIGAALGNDGRAAASAEDEAGLLRVLQTRPDLLLVMDNLEQMRGADRFLRRLLVGAPGVRILATSRLRIGVEAEMEVAVGPLPLPDGNDPVTVAAAPATALFLARAREIGALRSLDAGSARDVALVCQALDGLPLALELAAARTRLLTPGAILRRLGDASGGELLRRPGDRGPHGSLKTVMDWSLGLLAPPERRLLLAVATCVGPFDLETAAILCPGVDPLDGLDRLVMHGLIRLEQGADDEPRFRMLTTVRASCLRRVPSREAATLRRRHARAMLQVVVSERGHLAGTDAGLAFETLEARLDDIRAAFDAALGVQPGVAVRLIAEPWRFWPGTGRLREGVDRLRAALNRERGATRARGVGLAAMAAFQRRLAGHQASREAALEALEVARRTRVRAIALEALPAVALAAIDDGDLAAARRHARRLIRLAEAAGDEAARVRGLACLGVAEGELGDPSAGIRFLLEAVAHAHVLGDPLNEAAQLGNLAELELVRGIPRSAALHARAGVAILRRQGIRAELCGALATLANALGRIDRLDEAREALAETTALARELDSDEATRDVFLAALPYTRRLGAPEFTARLWGAAERGDGVLAEAIRARDRRLAQPDLNVALVQLGSAALDSAVRKGRAGDDGELLDELQRFVAQRGPDARRVRDVPGGVLTPRETEVLLLLGEGLGDGQIARRLGISAKTVSVHVSNVKGKLGLDTRVQAAMAARALDAAGTSEA